MMQVSPGATRYSGSSRPFGAFDDAHRAFDDERKSVAGLMIVEQQAAGRHLRPACSVEQAMLCRLRQRRDVATTG